MATDQRGSEILPATECSALLSRASGGIGRVAYLSETRITVTPVNFVAHDGGALLRLGPGTLLEALLSGRGIAFEVDQVETGCRGGPTAWSVLGHGRASVVTDPVALTEASALGLTPFVPDAGYTYVRIDFDALSGRRFALGALAALGMGVLATA